MITISIIQNTARASIGKVNKFFLNQFILTLSLVIFAVSWAYIFKFAMSGFLVVPFALNIICLHYLFNSIHQGSHGLLSLNKTLNYAYGYIASIFTGITFADFKFTHDLHHKHVGVHALDPDHSISGNGLVLLIPFKMWYHDRYFFQNNKSKKALFSYLSQRVLQVVLITFIILASSSFFILYWLIPMLIVGVVNALFLFYVPHYNHWIERTRLNVSVVSKSIYISRLYHSMHHDKPGRNYNFFPVEKSLMMLLLGPDAEVFKYKTREVKVF
jgi:fatty acid desaturase